jgi:putative membrane protein
MPSDLPRLESEEPAPSAPVAGGGSVPSHVAAPTATPPMLRGRLHPLTLVFGLWRAARLLIPAFFIYLINGRRTDSVFLYFLTFGAGVSLLQSLLGYFTFSYGVAGGELTTREGVLVRRERRIPLERVQEISLEQGVLHRLLGVVDARIETAGGQGPEASLSVLSRDEAERLRGAVFAGRTAAQADDGTTTQIVAETQSERPAPPLAAARRVIRQLSIGDLALAGLTSNHIVSAFALAGALWALADDLLPERIYRQLARSLYGLFLQLRAEDAAATLVASITIVVLILGVGMAASVVGSVVLFYGFTLSLGGPGEEDLHRAYGLFTRRSSSLPRRRIQVLAVEQSVARRLCGLATLRADIAGGVRERDDDNKGQDVLVPVVPVKEVGALLPLFLPGFEADAAEWRRVSRLAVRRGTMKGALFLAAASFALGLRDASLAALWPLALLPLVYLLNVVSYRTLGYALGERYLRTRRGWLGRSLHVVPVNKAQVIEVRRTPFDRRLGLASLRVDTAGQAFTGGGPQIGNLPVEEARALARTLAQRAALTEYKG